MPFADFLRGLIVGAVRTENATLYIYRHESRSLLPALPPWAGSSDGAELKRSFERKSNGRLNCPDNYHRSELEVERRAEIIDRRCQLFERGDDRWQQLVGAGECVVEPFAGGKVLALQILDQLML